LIDGCELWNDPRFGDELPLPNRRDKNLAILLFSWLNFCLFFFVFITSKKKR
jgi:hypothetical protein